MKAGKTSRKTSKSKYQTGIPGPRPSALSRLRLLLKLRPRQRARTRPHRKILFLGVAIALVGSGTVLALSLPQARVLTPYNVMYPNDLRKQYAGVVKQVGQLEDRQTKQNTRLVSDKQLQNMVSNIQLDAADGNFAAAKQDIATLQ